MAGAVQFTASFLMDWRDDSHQRVEIRHEQPHMVGEYYADYSELTKEELAASDPQADALIARSRVVSSKRL